MDKAWSCRVRVRVGVKVAVVTSQSGMCRAEQVLRFTYVNLYHITSIRLDCPDLRVFLPKLTRTRAGDLAKPDTLTQQQALRHHGY